MKATELNFSTVLFIMLCEMFQLNRPTLEGRFKKWGRGGFPVIDYAWRLRPEGYLFQAGDT